MNDLMNDILAECQILGSYKIIHQADNLLYLSYLTPDLIITVTLNGYDIYHKVTKHSWYGDTVDEFRNDLYDAVKELTPESFLK